MKLFHINYKVSMPIYGGASRSTILLQTHIKARNRKQALRKLKRKVKREMDILIYHDEQI